MGTMGAGKLGWIVHFSVGGSLALQIIRVKVGKAYFPVLRASLGGKGGQSKVHKGTFYRPLANRLHNP